MLNNGQMATLQAVVDRVIPPGDGPGGWDAGVGDYLAGQFRRDLTVLVDDYRAWLDGLDAEAEDRFGAPFTELDPEQQDALLALVEAGDVRGAWAVEPAAFFTMLANHCQEGYYGDPGNGGNRGGVVWESLGFWVRG